jgi:hypothetical protein
VVLVVAVVAGPISLAVTIQQMVWQIQVAVVVVTEPLLFLVDQADQVS